MWSPTHVQVLVKRARGLNVKGKNGTNDAFVTIGLAKEKFQTSVKERVEDPEWNEQCELTIPEQGNRAEVVLRVLHRSFMGGDEFLGQVTLPLQDFDVYEKPKSRWYPLACKPGQNKTGYRGDLEVKLGFTVRASQNGGQDEMGKKNRGSVTSLNKMAGNLGGSLLSLGGKEKKNLKKIAASVSNKVGKAGSKAKKSVSSLKLNKDKAGLASLPEDSHWKSEAFGRGGDSEDRWFNQDPGVNSDDEDDMFQFDTLSHRSSHSSLATGKLGTVSAVATPIQGSMESLVVPSIRPDPEPINTITTTTSTPTTQHTIQEPSARNQQTKPSEPQATDLQQEQMLSSLPSYSEAMKRDQTNKYPVEKKTSQENGKKKIIPVVSDSSESSPSPDEPSTPLDSPQPSSISSRFRMSQRSLQGNNDMASLGQKLKNSYSFRERPDSKFSRRSSVESVCSQGPPHGTRIVLGRETSPILSRVPQEIMDKFAGQTREDLIEMVVALQASVEQQGRKVADLEDYVDSLLIKVMEVSPILLEKNVVASKTIK